MGCWARALGSHCEQGNFFDIRDSDGNFNFCRTATARKGGRFAMALYGANSTIDFEARMRASKPPRRSQMWEVRTAALSQIEEEGCINPPDRRNKADREEEESSTTKLFFI